MKAIFIALVVVWVVVIAYSGLLLLGFYGEGEKGKRAVREFMAESGVTLDSLRSVKDPLSEYMSGARKSPERRRLLEMAMAAQSKAEGHFWPKQFGQWLVLFVLLPAGGLAVLKSRLTRPSTEARERAKP